MNTYKMYLITEDYMYAYIMTGGVLTGPSKASKDQWSGEQVTYGGDWVWENIIRGWRWDVGKDHGGKDTGELIPTSLF